MAASIPAATSGLRDRNAISNSRQRGGRRISIGVDSSASASVGAPMLIPANTALSILLGSTTRTCLHVADNR
jgi:hypothetical protein